MYKIIKNSWALFTTMIISHQGNLLGIRAVKYCYWNNDVRIFHWIFYWCKHGAQFVLVRVFAAFASIASLSALVHAVFVDPIVWTLSIDDAG